MAKWQTVSGIWGAGVKSMAVATRGERLGLFRFVFASDERQSEAFSVATLAIIEVNDENRMAAGVVFDLDDFGAATAELDARYLAGEAATHSHTWSHVAEAFAAVNKQELPKQMPDWVNIDHRRGPAFATGDMTAYIHDLWYDMPDMNIYVEVVHRLSNLGAVITQAAHGTSQSGFEAEWRENSIFMFDGDLISRCELFDEADLDAALARFEDLQPQARRLESAATRLLNRYLEIQMARDWDAMAEMLADDYRADDRRHVVGGGAHGRGGEIANARASADVGVADLTATVIAIRGERLTLSRFRYSGRDHGLETFVVELLVVGESNVHGRVAATVAYDTDDIDAAFDELEARYLAGEAAAHAHTWSDITQAYAAVNRHEMPPTTPDWVNIDYRRGRAFAPGDLEAYLHATWELAPDVNVYVEAVHRLGNLGGVVTHCAHGSSREGFDAEWREVILLTFEAGRVNHFEVFDEADLDGALARFDELDRL
jgi:hypothetical protein